MSMEEILYSYVYTSDIEKGNMYDIVITKSLSDKDGKIKPPTNNELAERLCGLIYNPRSRMINNDQEFKPLECLIYHYKNCQSIELQAEFIRKSKNKIEQFISSRTNNSTINKNIDKEILKWLKNREKYIDNKILKSRYHHICADLDDLDEVCEKCPYNVELEKIRKTMDVQKSLLLKDQYRDYCKKELEKFAKEVRRKNAQLDDQLFGDNQFIQPIYKRKYLIAKMFREEIELIDKSVAKPLFSYNWNGDFNNGLSELFNQLIENRFIDQNTKFEDFEKLFTVIPLDDITIPVRWIDSVRLLAYFLDALYMNQLIEEKNWQSIAGRGKLFKNKDNKSVSAHDLSSAKNKFEISGNPNGSEKIDTIISSHKKKGDS